MAYYELIKNFDRIRDYMREFYLYGFRSRMEFTRKSARSYDDERRRVESWLGDYMRFRQTPEGKNVFISIDSRVSRHNPLYAAWKTRSFTDGDITLHFILFDILHDPDTALTLGEICDEVDEYLSAFEDPKMFDESTIRKKLKEYVEEGILVREKHGKQVSYRRPEVSIAISPNVLDFFSEVAPCGVIGSFLLDKTSPHKSAFTFKHHYITSALDSEILCTLLTAIGERQSVTLKVLYRPKDGTTERAVIPLHIRISVQTGRQYLLAFVPRLERMMSFRIDNILSVRLEKPCEDYDLHRRELDRMMPHLWGVSLYSDSGAPMEHVAFTVCYEDDEPHIHKRLEREKRCGMVEKLDDHHSRFSADVYDARETIPWIRTFICRITDFQCSNAELEALFREDLLLMYRQYGLEGGEEE